MADGTRSTLLSPSGTGAVNRLRLLELLHSQGPLSRAHLARLFGVSRATIGTIVQPLLDSGALSESAEGRSTRAGGKPARPIWFSEHGTRLAAVEILPGQITAALLAVSGDVLRRATRQSAALARDREAFDAALAVVVEECLTGESLLGVGVAAAGLVDTGTGTVVEVNAMPALRDHPMAERIGQLLDVPVFVEHHARVQALGDRWFGSGRSLDSFASVSTGDSVGVGLVHQGAVVSRPGSASGAHMTVAKDGERCTCGNRGCWKTLTTNRWLRRRAEELGIRGARRTTVARLAGARVDDPAADALLDEYALNLALGLGNIEQILGPGVFILHGDAVAGGEALRDDLQRHLRDESPRWHGEGPRVVLADPHADAVLMGCAGLVLSNNLSLVR
ncbi:MAG: ROK family protein [Actinocatenispora sp.]